MNDQVTEQSQVIENGRELALYKAIFGQKCYCLTSYNKHENKSTPEQLRTNIFSIISECSH